jgi:hypothetical protein
LHLNDGGLFGQLKYVARQGGIFDNCGSSFSDAFPASAKETATPTANTNDTANNFFIIGNFVVNNNLIV